METVEGMTTERVKRVGRREAAGEGSPEAFCRRAAALQAAADRLNPFPKPRGFVFKARTWKDYETWRRSQSNPRLW